MSNIDTIKIIEKTVDFPRFPKDGVNFKVSLTEFENCEWNLEFVYYGSYWEMGIPTIRFVGGQTFVQLVSCRTQNKVFNLERLNYINMSVHLPSPATSLPHVYNSEFWYINQLKFRFKFQMDRVGDHSCLYFNLNDNFSDNDYYLNQMCLFHAPILVATKVIKEKCHNDGDLLNFLKTFGKGRERIVSGNANISQLLISKEESSHYYILKVAKKYKVYAATRQIEDLLIWYFYTHLYLKKSRKVEKLAKIGEEFQLRRLNVHLKRARLLVDWDVTTSSESSSYYSSESSSESSASEEL